MLYFARVVLACRGDQMKKVAQFLRSLPFRLLADAYLAFRRPAHATPNVDCQHNFASLLSHQQHCQKDRTFTSPYSLQKIATIWPIVPQTSGPTMKSTADPQRPCLRSSPALQPSRAASWRSALAYAARLSTRKSIPTSSAQFIGSNENHKHLQKEKCCIRMPWYLVICCINKEPSNAVAMQNLGGAAAVPLACSFSCVLSQLRGAATPKLHTHWFTFTSPAKVYHASRFGFSSCCDLAPSSA